MSTDRTTGNKEEAVEALKNGKGFLKQIVTMPDGTQKEMAIWGGYELDGYDRTLNVFIAFKDFLSFVKRLVDEEIDTEGIPDPCDQEEGYQHTVDFTDVPMTLIIRKDSKKIAVESYIRDERRSYRESNEEYVGEVELNAEGSAELKKEDIQEKQYLALILAGSGLRQYLLQEGIVQKLYDMFDESAGVVVKVGRDNRVITRIVKGRERPDLPCQMFLLGEQMCRPYIDEKLGLKSPEKRKPRDPELAAKLAEEERIDREKREAEKKRKEEEARRAEAERIAREKAEKEAVEAEKKRKEEEKRQKAVTKEQITQLCKDKVKQFETDLNALLETEKQQIKDQNAEMISKKEEEYTSLAQYRNTLGVFKFSEKKETDNKLTELQNEISWRKNGKKLASVISDGENKAKKFIGQYQEEVDDYLSDRFPYEKKLKEYMKENEQKVIGIQAFNVLVRSRRMMTAVEIAERIPVEKEKWKVISEAMRSYIRVGRISRTANRENIYQYGAVYGEKEIPLDINIGIDENYEDPIVKNKPIPEPPKIAKLCADL